MKKNLKSRLKLAAISGAMILSLGLFPQNADADYFNGINGGFGHLVNGNSKLDIEKFGPSFHYQTITAAVNIVGVQHRFKEDENLSGNESGIEATLGTFFSKTPEIMPYVELDFGISTMERRLRVGYSDLNIDKWNKTFGLGVGMSFNTFHSMKNAVATVMYKLRQTSDLSNTSFKEGLNSEGVYASFNARF